MINSLTGKRFARTGLISLFTSLIALPPGVLAGRTSTITVKVTVVAPPPCVVNGNRVIEVDFGDVIAPRVDGKQYLKNVDYSLECKGAQSNAMKLAIQGNATTFDNTALKTNVAEFGIAIRVNDQPLVINNWIKFNYPNKPKLQAVPVKRAGVELPGGEFNASATLMVNYQ
ncbi:fimbrial protein [Enterobacter ludwigii]|nr:fimbrial protein [Enterobacter asburiae]